MKIALHLLNSLKRGGAENVALNYSLVLKELGVQSVFVAVKDADDYEKMLLNTGIKVCYGLDDDLVSQAEYIFVHSNKNLLRLLKYRFLGKLKGKRIYYLQHLLFPESKFAALAKIINYVCTDFILITPRTHVMVNKYISIPIHRFINFYVNKYEKEDYGNIRASVRRELNVADDVKLVMFSAIFKPGKGLKDCLDIASYFAADNGMKFLIAGDGEERKLLDAYPHDNVIAIGCVNDVERYLIASDTYMFLSLFLQEMLPMALVEAINTDCPILAYRTVVNDYLMPDKTFETLTDMIKALEGNDVPKGFKHYDREYAVHMFRNLL